MAIELLQNGVFWSIVLAGACSQGLKILLLLARHGLRFHLADIVVTGGMPSTHSALVSALTVSIALDEGFSTAFFISLVLAVIVLRDALGVRRTAGEEGHVINQIIRKAKLQLPRLHYSLGHTPAQVTVGATIGVLAALVVSGVLA